MPYKSEKIRLSETQDRRRKLTEDQKEEIRKIYAEGSVGMRPLAEMYGVSRSLIQLIVNPAISERKKQRIKEHWRDYYDQKQLTDAIRNLRKYKQELYLKGELKPEEKEK